MKRRYLRLCVLALFFAVLSLVPAWSQRTSTGLPARSGVVRGQIKLPDGRPVSRGVTVSLDLRTGGTVLQSQTDSQGKFEFMQVPGATDYMVRVHLFGYQDEEQEADLSSMPTAYLSFTLKPDRSRSSPAVPPGGPTESVSALDAAAPSGARDKVESASDLMTKGKVGDSIKLLKQAIGEYSQYPHAYLLMGVAYSSQKKWDEAEASLQKSVELDQQNGAAYVALGAVENEKKKYPDAEKYLLKAAVLSPNAADVHSELGRTYWAQGRWQEAGQQVAKAIELRPDDAGQHVMMGNIQLRERNAEGALQEFQKAVQLDPNGPLAAPTRDMITRIENALKQAQNQKK